MTTNKLTSRILWATKWRKTRKWREEAYWQEATNIEKRVINMWHYLCMPGDPPAVTYHFDKSTAQAWVCLADDEDGRSAFLVYGGETLKKNHAIIQLEDDGTFEQIPWMLAPEIVAARLLASGSEGNLTANDYLTRYYEHFAWDPTADAYAWCCRLNTMVCNYFKLAPVGKLVMERYDEDQSKGVFETYKEVMDEFDHDSIVLPQCMTSNNEDGRYNMSYVGSCFYTIDRVGAVVCKEYPSEYLDIEDYEQLLMIANTIYRDITGAEPDDPGISFVNWLFKDTPPQWEGDSLLPREREEVEA